MIIHKTKLNNFNIKLAKLNFNSIFLILIVTFAFFVQFPRFKDIPVYLNSDSANYATLAGYFARGDFDKAVHVWWLPLYPFTAGIVSHLTHDIERALLFVSFFSGILLIIPIYLIVFEATKEKLIAGMAGLLTSFNPVNTKQYQALLTENFYSFLLAFSILFAVFSLRRKGYIYSILAGFTFSLAFLTRNEAFVFFLFYLGFCFLFFLVLLSNKYILDFRKIISSEKLGIKNSIKRIFLIAFFALITFILTATPYYGFLSFKFGFVNLSARQKAADNAYSPVNFRFNNQTTYAQDVWSVDTLNYKSPFFSKVIKPVKFDLWLDDTIHGSLKRLVITINFLRQTFNDQLFLLVIFGAIFSLSFFLLKKQTMLLANLSPFFGFAMTLPFLPGLVIRYILWLYPYFYILLFFGVYGIFKIFHFRFLKMVVLTITIILFVQILRNYIEALPDFNNKGNITYLKEVGEYIKSQGAHNPRIMSRREAISYYANGETIFAPGGAFTKEEFETYLKTWHVNYVVANLENIGDSPGLLFMLDETKVPNWLVPVKIFGEGKWKIIIYKVS